MGVKPLIMTIAYSPDAVTAVESLQAELAQYRSGIKAITLVAQQAASRNLEPRAMGIDPTRPIGDLATAATGARSTAQGLSNAAESASLHSTSVAAAAAEEITVTVSVTEIERQALETRKISQTAVVEQRQANDMVSRNIQEAALVTRDVAQSITTVSTAVHDTSSAAGQMLGAADGLSHMADRMRTEVDTFLHVIRNG